MVEMTQAMFRKVFIYALGAAFLTAGALHAQQPKVEARIAGLEGNAEYMSLLREDAQLQLREDSIVNAVERMRQRLREAPSRRQELSQEILQQESRIFEIRNAKGRLIDRINTIEQEWVLARPERCGPAACGTRCGRSCGDGSRFAEGPQSGGQSLLPRASPGRGL